MGLPPFDPDAPAWSRAEPGLSEQPPPFDDLGALYDACGSAVYRLALRLSRSSQEAEDLSHDVFLRYWQQGRYEPARGPVLAYLLLLTRSMAINRLNQRRNRWLLLQRWSEQLLPASVKSPLESAEQSNLAERVRAALAAIPANQRQVLELAYYEGLSQSVIGERLQLPLGTVKTRSRQGLIRLRELLIDFGERTMNPHDPSPAGDTPFPDRFAVDALLAGHALGDLDASEREQLAALLLQHPELRQRLEEFQTTLELLPLALPATAPPPQRLRRRLLQRLSGVPGELAPPDRGRQWRGGLAPFGTWLVPALMGIALLGLGLQLQQTRQQLARIEQRVKERSETLAAPAPVSRRMVLEPVDPLTQASGEVMVTGNPTHNVLMLNNLPPPPPHHVYRLWANVDGQKVGCVAFVPTEQGHVAMLIPTMPTSVATSVSVSVETDQVGAHPTGRVVLSSSI